MKRKMYINSEQEDRFVKENPNYEGRRVECRCGESWGYEDFNDPDAPLVISCDACWSEAGNFEKWY